MAMTLLAGLLKRIGSRSELQRNPVDLILPLDVKTHGCLRRPLKRNTQQLAATHFASRFDDQLVVPWHKFFQRCGIAVENDLMRARRTRRAAQPVGRHRQFAASTPPPLPHVLQPLGSFVVLELGVVPDSEVDDFAAIGALQPEGDIGL